MGEIFPSQNLAFSAFRGFIKILLVKMLTIQFVQIFTHRIFAYIVTILLLISIVCMIPITPYHTFNRTYLCMLWSIFQMNTSLILTLLMMSQDGLLLILRYQTS